MKGGCNGSEFTVRMKFSMHVLSSLHGFRRIAYFVLSVNIMDATTRMNIYFIDFTDLTTVATMGLTYIAQVNFVVPLYWSLLPTVQYNLMNDH